MRLVPLVFLVACGNSSAAPDAPVPPDDAPPDSSSLGCDYSEQRDVTNDDVADGTPEDTGLTHTTRTVVCGQFDSTHFDGDITVDVDGYTFELATESDLLVRLHGAGAENIELVGVDIYTGAALDQLVGQLTFYGDHAVTAVHLPAGTYELAAFALAGAAIAAPVPYRLEIAGDSPEGRCPAIATGGFAEANDGGASTGNDVITIPSGAPPALSSGTPEPTLLTLAPDAPTRVTGTSANVTVTDQYEDKDTFEVTTSADTNELGFRLDWTGAADLDIMLLEPNMPQPIMRAIAESNTAPETKTFSVKPSTTYWVLVGAKVGSTLPVTYSASLCGATFTP